jgi:hypothetical protein
MMQQQVLNNASWIPRILQLSCLKPSYTLRRQLVAGYGITAFITVFIVVSIAIIAALRAGDKVRDESSALFQRQLDSILQDTGVLTGDILDKKMNNLKGSVELLVEVVRDRIVGYPNDGWEDDSNVPFVDLDTGIRAYPLKADLLPRDWMIEPNLRTNDIDVLWEHLQERFNDDGMKELIQLWNTESSMFVFQGVCDPNLTDPTQIGYYPFCTEENNDASLGGKINPTTTLAPLEQKAADIGIFLKAIYEAQPLALNIGVVFANSGAGAMVLFPSFKAVPGLEYTSEGCEWMRESNTLTGRPLGTEEEMNRCTPKGTRQTTRQYNGLEREWCADQALHPGETRIFGPYAPVSELSWRLTIGRAVFDRMTNEFIGCAHIDLSLLQAQKLLEDVSEDMPSDIVLTKPDGTVVVGAVQSVNGTVTSYIPKLWETDFIDSQTYRKLTDDLAFWEGEWDIESARKKYNFSVKSKGKYYTVFPSPVPPDEYDPLYKPDFYIFGAIDALLQDEVITEINDQIKDDVTKLIILSVSLGALGFCCVIAVVAIVAEVLTRPLKWIAGQAWEIVNHTNKRASKRLVVVEENEVSIHFFSFMPKTEVQELVSEFRSMISGFSGKGPSQVAVPRHTETRNLVTWKEDFRKFYSLAPSLELEMKGERNIITRSVSKRMSKKSAMRLGSIRNNSIRRSSTRRSAVQRASFRRSSVWSNTASFPMSTSDFEKVLAAADDYEQQEQEEGQPVFRSTQIIDQPLSETSDQFNLSPPPFWTSSTLSATSEVAPVDYSRSRASMKIPRHPTRINLGSNIRHDASKKSASSSEETEHRNNIARSPLFWNILCWIVIPLLAAIIAVMSIVSFQMRITFPAWIDLAETASYNLEKDHLDHSTILIKKHMEQIFVRPLHDLYTINRIAGWLLFDAVGQSDGISDIEMELTEECKYYENQSECPFLSSDVRSPCPCEWHDPWERTCKSEPYFTLIDSPRYVQKLWYLNQDRDRGEVYPAVDYSPNSTSWYTDPYEMHGSDNSSDTEGYLTAFGRVRAASALSTIIFPVYNRGSDSRASGYTSSTMSGYIAFDANGEYGGFSGCNYDAAGYAFFESSTANNAFIVNPEVCPRGKFGYDPRCRGWYASAKEGAVEDDDMLYISPPYRYATTNDVGNTAASSLIDPKSGEYVGNTLIDFKTTEIENVVDKTNKATISYAVILRNVTENVVVSSALPDGSIPVSVYDLLAPYDPPGTPNYDRFFKIINDMEDEIAGRDCDLYRTDENGVVKQYCFAYEPIFHREMRPLQPDDFSRGAEHYYKFLYSIILFQDEDELKSEFLKSSDDIKRDLIQSIVFYISATILTTLICVFVTAMVSLNVTRPMIQLLRTVKKVNEGRVEDDMPPLKGGSREVHQVYASFAKLYKTVRMSNSAFFVGELSLAHRIALDSLRLFRKIGDRKAIAIGCNNMGNTLLAWMVECREPGTSLEIEGDYFKYCTEAAIAYYTEAVEFGAKDLERASGDAEKSEFAQQLADRHFNRAMCLLLTVDDPCASDDAKEKALDDLFLVRQYDQGVKEYMLHSKTLLENSDVIFERSVRRLHGLAALIDSEPDVWDVWDIYELVDQADLMLQAAWAQDEAPLFRNMTKIGRLQELEGAVTGIEFSSGKGNDAIQLATRMLIEDEYLLDSTFIEAADAILQYSIQGSDDSDSANSDDEKEGREKAFQHASIMELKSDFKKMRTQGMRNSLDIGRAFVFCIDLKGEWNGRSLLSDLRKAILSFYEENFQPNDVVGIVTFDPNDGDLKRVEPSSVKEVSDTNQYPHKKALVAATTGVACSRFSPALQGGIDMALEIESSSASDICLLYVSDGGAYDEPIYSRLQSRIEASSRTGDAHVRASSNSTSMASSIDLVVIGLEALADPLPPPPTQEHPSSRASISTHLSNASASMHIPLPTFEESCTDLVLATRNRASVYLEADPDNLDDAFKRATASINEGTSFAGNRLQRALTMEKF